MHYSRTLTFYFARQIAFWLAVVFLSLASITELFDVIELLRRAAAKSDVTSAIVIKMALLKMPYLVQEMLPFAILFGAMFAFWKLAKANELIVTRAAGVSAWQILIPALSIAMLVGIFQITIFNPIATTLLSKYEEMDNQYMRRSENKFSIGPSGLWLRQSIAGEGTIIHAQSATQGVNGNGTVLENVTAYQLDKAGHFSKRIDAAQAELGAGVWVMSQANVSTPDGKTVFQGTYDLKTDFTKRRIEDSFASADTLSFWELPRFINAMEKAGFNSAPHRLEFNTLLSTPFLFCAMILIAATFSMRAGRRTSAGYMIIGGVISGFVLYFFTNVVHALGLSTGMPVALAAWLPAGVSLMLGATALLHLEEG